MPKKACWEPQFFTHHPIMTQLNEQTRAFERYSHWPTLEQYQGVFKEHAIPVTPVPQREVITDFQDNYEPRIFLKKELQTRTENWHDFFNAMIWLKFPHTKRILNQLHYQSVIKREKGTNRSTLENRITQFDECGAVIISQDPALLELIKSHQWHTLFCDNKVEFKDNIRCVIFGHAMFEKALKPYIGMTCHCLLICDPALLQSVKQNQFADLDKQIATLWHEKMAHTPNKLHAFPVLGIPGYWPDQSDAFYSNTTYFR